MKKTLILLAVMLMVCVGGQAMAQYYYTTPNNTYGADGELIFKAASTGDVATIQRLANQNPDLVNLRSDKDGKTPLHIAAMVGKYDAVLALLNRGADPNVKDNYCRTPYAYAKMGYWHKTATLLRKRGAKPERVKFFPHCCTTDHPNPARRSGYKMCTPEGG